MKTGLFHTLVVLIFLKTNRKPLAVNQFRVTQQQQMGSSESTLSSSSSTSQPIDQITTVSERTEGVDPLVQRFKSLHIAKPILTSSSPSSTDGSLTDILVKKRPTPSSSSGALNPKILLELFSMYHDWQEAKVKQIAERQEGIENKIEVVDALAVKLLQRFNGSASAMRTTSRHLSEVQPLQVEVGELKGRLTEVISNCDALCKRIAAEGPESLRSTVKPFSASIAYIEPEQCSSSPTVLIRNSSTSTAT